MRDVRRFRIAGTEAVLCATRSPNSEWEINCQVGRGSSILLQDVVGAVHALRKTLTPDKHHLRPKGRWAASRRRDCRNEYRLERYEYWKEPANGFLWPLEEKLAEVACDRSGMRVFRVKGRLPCIERMFRDLRVDNRASRVLLEELPGYDKN